MSFFLFFMNYFYFQILIFLRKFHSYDILNSPINFKLESNSIYCSCLSVCLFMYGSDTLSPSNFENDISQQDKFHTQKLAKMQTKTHTSCHLRNHMHSFDLVIYITYNFWKCKYIFSNS